VRFLITAGSTQAPIDRVRSVVNAHSHKTGSALARTAWVRGHHVTVLTSEPEALTDFPDPASDSERRASVIPFRTFDDLTDLLHQAVKGGTFDAIFHAASVSDYLIAGSYSLQAGTSFNARTKLWDSPSHQPTMVEQKGQKISSKEPELWLRMVRAPKLIERFRGQWGYRGYLVKFKQESGVSDNDLVQLAERSRLKSDADLIVASTVESAHHWSYVGPVDGRYDRIARRELADYLILTLEHITRTDRNSSPEIGLGGGSSAEFTFGTSGSKPEIKVPSRATLFLPNSKVE
jgi:phosphopantothenoylcysteine synthetase/decarboxylase